MLKKIKYELYHWYRALSWFLSDLLGMTADNTNGIPIIIIDYHKQTTVVITDPDTLTYNHKKTTIPAEHIKKEVWRFTKDNRYQKQK